MIHIKPHALIVEINYNVNKRAKLYNIFISYSFNKEKGNHNIVKRKITEFSIINKNK